jgi:hypothetical protein
MLIARRQKYPSSCDHSECQDSPDTYGKTVVVYDFPPRELWKFGDRTLTFCQHHFTAAMESRGVTNIAFCACGADREYGKEKCGACETTFAPQIKDFILTADDVATISVLLVTGFAALAIVQMFGE